MRRVVLAADSNRSLRCDRGFSESWFDESTADVIFREDQIHHPFLLWRLWRQTLASNSLRQGQETRTMHTPRLNQKLWFNPFQIL